MPDVLVVGTALWHVLHVHNAAAYERQLALLRKLKLAMLPSIPAFFLAPSQVTWQHICYCIQRHVIASTGVATVILVC